MNPTNRLKGPVLQALLVLCVVPACQRTQSHDSEQSSRADAETNKVSHVEVTDEQIVAFCGGCHALPRADSFPKANWYDEVKRGFAFYHQSKRKDLVPPPVQPVVDYFRSRAPEALEIAAEKTTPNPAGVHFHTSEIPISVNGQNTRKPAAISFVGHRPHSDGRDGSDLIFSDMANGGLFLEITGKTLPPSRCLAVLQNPAAAARCDLNGNGLMDLVVADLGSFNPADHHQGRVLWIADIDDVSTANPPVALCVNIGRVADVQPADFDDDGDVDLVVAEFGWHQSGRILWLENQGDRNSPNFIQHVIDPRSGTIHVPVVDLNGDGKPDFVALISQEFEVIEAFLNHGNGSFQKRTIHSAGDPAFGSSGIQIVDMDGDGDYDVLYTNGDMFDSFLIKPYHGIQWLENRGEFPFAPHRLIDFPGVHRALAGDLDGDGDLDLVAAAFLPASIRESAMGKKRDSLIWLEQSGSGEFLRHALETGHCLHAALDLTDIDGDGDLDIAVGSFRDNGPADQSAITIWWNDTVTKRR